MRAPVARFARILWPGVPMDVLAAVLRFTPAFATLRSIRPVFSQRVINQRYCGALIIRSVIQLAQTPPNPALSWGIKGVADGEM